MKDIKKAADRRSGSLSLGANFKALEENLTILIDTLEDIKALKAARKELKRYRTAIGAIERQVQLYEKDCR